MTEEPARKLRLRLEKEFWDGRPARNLARGLTPEILPPLSPADYGRFGPRDLLVTANRGRFLKPCPGAVDCTCCGLHIFHFGLGCNLGCRYCILAAYLGTEALVLFGNVEEGLAEFAALLDRPPTERPRRFGTGEFTDSLLLDRRSGLAEQLVTLVAGREATLELKTKTDQVGHLLGLDHRGHTVISFSLNAPAVAEAEEGRAAPLAARLRAAARAAEAGYPIGLHFDPLIVHPGWEEGYARTVSLIGQTLAGAQVAWVSLGCFRYLPPLKEIMLARHPDTHIFDGEFISGGDGKKRYPRPLRTRMYRALAEGLRRVLPPETALYLCMETPRVWRDVFGRDPGPAGLAELLDRRAASLVTAVTAVAARRQV
ncbi:MAG: DNA photolyase [Candidatus Adiutrix sp.]|jgi:spore photoproduct lyase|nr:DNA photolyase [Candidatus Adiutrix sp.]